jgi:hypothetical protein
VAAVDHETTLLLVEFLMVEPVVLVAVLLSKVLRLARHLQRVKAVLEALLLLVNLVLVEVVQVLLVQVPIKIRHLPAALV